MNNSLNALSYFEKTLVIRTKIFSQDHRELAEFYNNIGSVYHKVEDYNNALLLYRKPHELFVND